MKYFFVYFLLTSAAFGEITQNDLIEIINKVDSYGIVPKSLIDHAKEEVKTLKPADIQQINSASKIQAPKIPINVQNGPNKEGMIPENIKEDLEKIKENAKKRQELLDSVMEE